LGLNMHEKCIKCKYREHYVSNSNQDHINLCIVLPYEEDEEITTWLDVEDFDSSDCCYFKEVRNIE